jgi:predicted nucleic acid-binding protein
MASVPRRVYWDACIWIALIQKEKVYLPTGQIEDREMMCRTVIEAAKRRSIVIVTSTLCLAEVCKDDPNPQVNSDKLKDYFESDYILLANVDRFVGERARDLMVAAYAKIKPPDAIHLATAAISPNIEAMHTFDIRLLNLDGRINKDGGGTLKICKPDAGGSPAPLLEAMHAGKPSEDNPAPEPG